ncbi:MAG: hypothetical protein KAR80_03850 [Rhodospirillaceae bacterium]|nr:hypothetical protein [Rhodospirillaceae bacterium]
MSWPKNDDGTVDWESVFTDPKTGFIPTVIDAKSLDALESCTTVVIDSLFGRDSDEEYRKAYMAALNHIFLSLNGDEHIETIRARLVTMLHSIKENRISRAAEYQKAKQLPDGDERRMSPDNPLAAINVLGE